MALPASLSTCAHPLPPTRHFHPSFQREECKCHLQVRRQRELGAGGQSQPCSSGPTLASLREGAMLPSLPLTSFWRPLPETLGHMVENKHHVCDPRSRGLSPSPDSAVGAEVRWGPERLQRAGAASAGPDSPAGGPLSPRECGDRSRFLWESQSWAEMGPSVWGLPVAGSCV